MTLKARCILGVVLGLIFIVIVNMVRKRELELKYVLAWIFCDVALFVMVFVPGLMERIASLLGIYSPMNMVFFLGFLFSLIIIFSLTVALSRVTAKMRRIAQVLALQSEEGQELGEK